MYANNEYQFRSKSNKLHNPSHDNGHVSDNPIMTGTTCNNLSQLLKSKPEHIRPSYMTFGFGFAQTKR